MWLINTNTLRLEEFVTAKDIPYAILSHRWGLEEIKFEEMQAGTGRDKAGFQKILHCCQQAQQDHLVYAWVDTCCIDKRSSTELSEAINSMFAWYANAEVCYAFLADVDATIVMMADKPQNLASSSWFTRSWTLQELIAPSKVIFYDSHWRCFGTRHSLADHIAELTGIDARVLNGDRSHMDNVSIAQKMSWASLRTATREEDIAYSLFGIFGVSLPLLYGEGSKAFRRLQEEIIRQGTDQSILAWSCPSTTYGGLLATSPSAFQTSRGIFRVQREDQLYETLFEKRIFANAPLTIIPNGVGLQLALSPWSPRVYIAWLQCCQSRKRLGSTILVSHHPVGIFLFKKDTEEGFSRISVNGTDVLNSSFDYIDDPLYSEKYTIQSIHVHRQALRPIHESLGKLETIIINQSFVHHKQAKATTEVKGYISCHRSLTVDTFHASRTEQRRSALLIEPGGTGLLGEIEMEATQSGTHEVSCSALLGLNLDSRPVCFLTSGNRASKRLYQNFSARLKEKQGFEYGIPQHWRRMDAREIPSVTIENTDLLFIESDEANFWGLTLDRPMRALLLHSAEHRKSFNPFYKPRKSLWSGIVISYKQVDLHTWHLNIQALSMHEMSELVDQLPRYVRSHIRQHYMA